LYHLIGFSATAKTTTPNPTSGFYLLLPEDQIYDTSLDPEEAFKLIISAGMVQNK